MIQKKIEKRKIEINYRISNDKKEKFAKISISHDLVRLFLIFNLLQFKFYNSINSDFKFLIDTIEEKEFQNKFFNLERLFGIISIIKYRYIAIFYFFIFIYRINVEVNAFFKI